MDDILKAMRESGFTPKQNTDEDFPALKGEYRVEVAALKPWTDKQTGDMTSYVMEVRLNETLSGDKGDGRKLSKWYRVGGTDREGSPLAPTAKAEALSALCNDIFTMGGQLDLTSPEAFEASFASALGLTGYARAYWFEAKDGSGKRIQQWVVKGERDLRKESKVGAGREAPPF